VTFNYVVSNPPRFLRELACCRERLSAIGETAWPDEVILRLGQQPRRPCPKAFIRIDALAGPTAGAKCPRPDPGGRKLCSPFGCNPALGLETLPNLRCNGDRSASASRQILDLSVSQLSDQHADMLLDQGSRITHFHAHSQLRQRSNLCLIIEPVA
jgi:hypothetical protein